MATPDTPMLVPLKSQAALLEFYRQCTYLADNAWDIRSFLENMDKKYQRETDKTSEQRQAKLANHYGDTTKFQNVTVPVVMPAVEAAVTYQASVFLTGVPLFGVVAGPQWIDQAKQLETIIDNQAVRGGWVLHLMKAFRDGFKYNLGMVEAPWETEVTASMETDTAFSLTQGRPKEQIWQGNKLRHLDLYNTFYDMRVLPSEIPYEAEFAGYTRFMSRIKFKEFIARLPDKILTNVKAALESHALGDDSFTSSYYVPNINPAIIRDPNKLTGTDWFAWAQLTSATPKIHYANGYEVTTLYARILPSDFGLRVPSENTPQIWKFIFVNHTILLYAERQTNAHNMIPILPIQPYDDGLGYQTKPLTEHVAPFQDLASALWNSAIAARRRAISDRTLYDPSRVDAKHINNPNPSAKIPVRPQAYGKPLNEAVYPFPFRDDASGAAIQEASQLLNFANAVTGQNPVRQGQFVKGNKTQREFETVMGNANGRDQTIAIGIEAQFFTPLKHILKTNILQFQAEELLIDRATGQQLQIDPIQLRKAVMEFKVSDGLTPTDKLINADAWITSVQTLGSSPQIAQGYNVAPAFSYLMKTQGADLSPFEKSPEQLAYEQALMAWQTAIADALKQGVPAQQLPPQPKPADYGYQPQALQGASQQQQPPRVNNITNNITNVGD